MQQTVFVIDDDEAMRDSIHWLLDSGGIHSEMYASAADYLQARSEAQQGCILLDVRMPDMSGMELLQELKHREIDLPVIMITGHGDVPMAVRAMKDGAFDFVQKPFNAQELLDKVHAALSLDQEHRRVSLHVDQLRHLYSNLTEREREVAELIVSGQSSKNIAVQLGISPKTVDIHRANIMKKLNAKTIAEIVQIRMSMMDA